MSGWAWLRVAAILGFLSVALGAFGAHALKDRFTVYESDSFLLRNEKQRKLENFETAARYQMYHALALLGVAFLVFHGKSGTAASVAGWSFVAGTVFFSGSLYAFVLTEIRGLVALTPIGGVAFLVGWLAMAVAAGGNSRP